MIVGIDEAGRGPVLGPMVVGAFAIRPEDYPKLLLLGVKDSKLLAKKRRSELALALADLASGIHLIEIPPARLDRENLNDLELEAFAEGIRKLKPSAVFIDAPVGPRGIPRFRDRLAALLPSPVPDLTLENRADVRFPVVSAASILAKVRRDAIIAELAVAHGDLGSGYPSDPKTRNFLLRWQDEHGGIPPFARASWGTFDRLKQERFAF